MKINHKNGVSVAGYMKTSQSQLKSSKVNGTLKKKIQKKVGEDGEGYKGKGVEMGKVCMGKGMGCMGKGSGT